MTNEERLLTLEAEMSIAKAHISSIRQATLNLAFELCSCRPDIPERLARGMMDIDAAKARDASGSDAELTAIEIEVLAEAIQGMAM